MTVAMADVLGKLVSANPAASLLPGGLPGGDVKAAGLSKIQDFLKAGYPIEWLGFLALSAIPPLGFAGMNLIVGGSMVWGAAKAAVQGLLYFLQRYIRVYYPSLWIYSLVLMVSPWFIFDILQTLSPAFVKEGYKLPFTTKSVAASGGKGAITPLSLSAILAVFSAGSYAWVQSLPKEIVSSAKPVLDIVAIAVGGVSALSAGGIGGMMVLPQLFTSLKGVMGSAAPAATATAAPEPAPVIPTNVPAPVPAAPVPAAPPAPAPTPSPEPAVAAASGPSGPQTGGGGVGSAIPSLRSIANTMLGPAPYGDPANYYSKILAGGGKARAPPQELNISSIVFVGSLITLGLGGIALAAARRKEGLRGD